MTHVIVLQAFKYQAKLILKQVHLVFDYKTIFVSILLRWRKGVTIKLYLSCLLHCSPLEPQMHDIELPILDTNSKQE